MNALSRLSEFQLGLKLISISIYRKIAMQVFTINPLTKEIHAVEIADTKEALQELIGFSTIDSDEIDDNGDRLFFDEECFIRQQGNVGRFKVDSLAPVAGIGVIVNSQDGKTFQSAIINAEELVKRVTYL